MSPMDKSLTKFWLCTIQRGACMFPCLKCQASIQPPELSFVQSHWLPNLAQFVSQVSTGAGMWNTNYQNRKTPLGAVIKYACIFMNTSHFSTDHTTWTFTKICKTSWKLHEWQWTSNETFCITFWYVTSRPSGIPSHCQALQYLA